MDTNSKKTVLPAMMNFKKNKSEDSLSGSKDKEIISLKEEINTKDQVINNQEKVIKCLKVSLDQEKEEGLPKNKKQIERFKNLRMSLTFGFVTHYGIQYLGWPLTCLLVVVIYCFYLHLYDQVLAQPQTNDEIGQEEQKNLDKLLKEISYLKDSEAKKDKEILKAKASKSTLIEKNAALWEANEKNEQEKIQHLNQIESLRYELVNETKHLKDELEHAHYDINIQYAEVTFLKKEVKRLEDSLSKAMNQGKSNVQEIAKHVIVIERLKSELAREMLNSRCAGILHEKKGQMINLDDIKIKVDEFNRMKDMIRNNLEVNCLNVTFEVNNS